MGRQSTISVRKVDADRFRQAHKDYNKQFDDFRDELIFADWVAGVSKGEIVIPKE